MKLVDPHVRYHRSFLAAADEFLAAGDVRNSGELSWPADDVFPGAEFTRAELANRATFADMVALIRSQALPGTPRPATYVPFTERWMVADDEYVGRISLRHELNELLFTWGGHIGYAVRPSARRRGYASAALAGMLPLCVEHGIDPVLVTCDVDNVGSRKVIEGNAGVYEDTREGKLRFWVPTT